MHDTIPFRYPPSRALAPLMRRYIDWMARHSTLVVTDSEFSKQSLQDDLGLSAERIAVLTLAIDHDVADRVRARRESTPPAERVLFVGRDAPHKNLDRLVRGFGASTFAQQGGVLTVAGVDGCAVDRLRSVAETHRARIDLPDGFEYKLAEVGNTVACSVSSAGVSFELANTYAQLNRFEWKSTA